MEYYVEFGEQTMKEITDALKGVDVQELSVTQNGTYTAPEGKAYSPVKVNVSGGGGSSDFSVAEVTIRNTTFPDFDPVDYLATSMPVIYDNEYNILEIENPVLPITVEIPLYKGSVITTLSAFGDVAVEDDVADISGDIELINGYQLEVTGDCEIGIGYGK